MRREWQAVRQLLKGKRGIGGWGVAGGGTRSRKEWYTKGGHSHLEHNVIRKHVFDTVHHVLGFRLSEFSGFRRGTEKSTQFGKLANARKLF